jgi:L-alanine-DL-glutamate epimerase-like enolase superfamily enzyme
MAARLDADAVLDARSLATAVASAPPPAAWAAFQVGLAVLARRDQRPQTEVLADALELPCATRVRSAVLVTDGGAELFGAHPDAGRAAPNATTRTTTWPRSWKWKTPPADAAALRRFRHLHPSAALRLDGNQRLAARELAPLIDACVGALEFVEEPCPPTQWALLPRDLPLALDESLEEYSPGSRALDVVDALELGARVLVLKPATLGPARALTLGVGARRAGLDVVVSSVGEGPAGLRALVVLHAVLGTRDAGLGTWRGDAATRTLFADDGFFVGALP